MEIPIIIDIIIFCDKSEKKKKEIYERAKDLSTSHFMQKSHESIYMRRKDVKRAAKKSEIIRLFDIKIL